MRLIFVCMWHYSRYSYYLRAMFTLLRAPECAANICVHVALQKVQLLFEGSVYFA